MFLIKTFFFYYAINLFKKTLTNLLLLFAIQELRSIVKEKYCPITPIKKKKTIGKTKIIERNKNAAFNIVNIKSTFH